VTHWIKIASLNELPPGTRTLREIHGHRLAVFNLNGELLAIDNHCSHQHGPIAAGELSDTTLTCPWHGLRFDLVDGRCQQAGHAPLRKYLVRRSAGMIQLDLDSLAARGADGGQIDQYVVRYGNPGYVGRFGTVHKIACQRGEWVLVATDRGEEVGEVLRIPTDLEQQSAGPNDMGPRVAGELLRILSAEELQSHRGHVETASKILQDCESFFALKDLPIVLVDAEILFDRSTTVVYYLGDAQIELGALASELAGNYDNKRLQFEATSINQDSAHETSTDEEPTMKGPYERTKYDFRRVWECPECHHKERTAGSVTSNFCYCDDKKRSGPGIPMKLVEDGPR